jgi:hypothetical protein
MSFSIRFLDEPPFIEEGMAPHAHGILSIGAFEEGFYASLFHWSREQYEKQWSGAIRDILNGANKSALIVSFLTPDVASNLEWWPMYRADNVVYFQNHLLFFDQLERPFSAECPVASLRDRNTIAETGDPISEWSLKLIDLETFLRSIAVR